MEIYGDGLFWYIEEDDGSFVIGATEDAIDEAGDLFRVILADGDEDITEDFSCGEIRGERETITIPAPFNLKVMERNESILENCELLSEDPLGEGWLFRALAEDA
ncbi:MAG: hypothetical protein AB8E15_05555 [Bdellovibrionales bacterium]